MNKRIRHILLDLGGVVFQSAGFSNAHIDWKIISALNEKYGYELNIGQDKFPDFLKEYNSKTEQHLSGKEFLREVFNTLEFNKELIELLRIHSEITIVSDNYRENIAYISQRYNFHQWSVRQIYSFDYGMVKSNPTFFIRLLEDLNDCQASELLFIDDSPDKLASAAEVGIRGILFKNNQELSRKIKKFQF